MVFKFEVEMQLSNLNTNTCLMFQEIILVEGLKLDDIQPGVYSVHCLPLRLTGAEGSPIRCILIK